MSPLLCLRNYSWESATFVILFEKILLITITVDLKFSFLFGSFGVRPTSVHSIFSVNATLRELYVTRVVLLFIRSNY